LEPLFGEAEIRRQTVWVTMRDGVRLATDLYLPPAGRAPSVAIRTPYDRANPKLVETCLTLARQGYNVISQDCRGTGASEPEAWDYYVYESDDSFDFVEWVIRQEWFDGFIGAFGGSYSAQTQWCMSAHPAMSAIVPEVGGLGFAFRTSRLYMFLNAYARSVGKGADKSSTPLEVLERKMLPETLAGGYFNEPLHPSFPATLRKTFPFLDSLPPAEAKRALWDMYCSLTPSQRAALITAVTGEDHVTAVSVEHLTGLFGHTISHDALTVPHTKPAELCRQMHAPALLLTGWYDWGLDDVLATWKLLTGEGNEKVREGSRLIITPSAHNTPGYREGAEDNPELTRSYRSAHIVDLLVRWYAAVRENRIGSWPRVIYYLMGANEWRTDSNWPPANAREEIYYLGEDGILFREYPPTNGKPDEYIYDPHDPPPTMGGSIVSNVYTPGSVDVSETQRRPDMRQYTTAILDRDLEVVGPLRVELYASSSAVDTDFCVRLSDVFPDGRAIQLQSNVLRARHRGAEPELLEPGRIYKLDIDLWATANRFKSGHRLRVDISSGDFPKFDRNANRGGEPGPPISAHQKIFRDSEHPSRIVLSILD
jgi:predicted acyl esterase